MNETKAIEPIENTANEGAAEIVAPKPYTFRKLSADDVFLMVSIVSKIGIREFRACFEDETLGKMIEKFMKKSGDENKGNDESGLYVVATVALLPAVDIILGNLEKCKDNIYALLSQVSGMKVDEIRADALLFTEMLIDFFKKPEFPDFMKVVSKLLK